MIAAPERPLTARQLLVRIRRSMREQRKDQRFIFRLEARIRKMLEREQKRAATSRRRRRAA